MHASTTIVVTHVKSSLYNLNVFVSNIFIGGDIQPMILGYNLGELVAIQLLFMHKYASLRLAFLELKERRVDLLDPGIGFIFAGSEAP